MDSIVSLCLGLGLAAACGLRVFVPLLVMSVGAKLGMVHLTPEFAVLGSWGAMVALSLVCVAEIAAYYVPWVDHAMDVVATPAAVIAGAVTTAAQMGIISPVHAVDVTQLAGAGGGWVQPVIGVGSAIAGGGLAGIVQSSTVAARATTTYSTGGILNPIISTIENVAAIVLSVLAVLVPVLLGLAALVIGLIVVRRMMRKRAARLSVA